MSQKLRSLQARKASTVDAMRAIANKADETGALSAEDQKAYDDHKVALSGIEEALSREIDLIAAEARIDSSNALGIVLTDRAAQDDKRGFKTFGEFAGAVASASIGRGLDNRLAAAPTTYGNEATGADGGFAIPPEFSKDIWRLSLGEDSLIPLTQNTEIGGNSMIFPKDESTPWGSSGVQVYWQSEAQAANQSKPALGTEALVLHKMMALVPVTNELIADGFAIGSYLQAVAPERITWKANEAILFGDGVGKPFGALTSDAVVTQAKDSGQQTGTLSATNISNMVSRLLVGELKNAFWLGNPDILPPLEGLAVGNYPIFLPGMTAANAPYGMLKGRPLMLSEHASAFSSKGDLNLLSLKGYRTITKAGGVETATSMHLYFDADATAFRFTFRMNGKPILSAPVVPPKSSNTRSHFVTLAAR